MESLKLIMGRKCECSQEELQGGRRFTKLDATSKLNLKENHRWTYLNVPPPFQASHN